MKTYSSILPGAVLLLAAVLFLRYATQWDSFPAFVGIYPYVVWVAGMLLGLRFNRSRLVFSVLVLAVADQALLRYIPAGSAGDDADPIVFRAVAFLLPLNLAAISLITERGFGTPRGMARLGLILSQLVLVGWIVRPELAGPPVVRDRLYRLVAASTTGASGIRGGLCSPGCPVSSPSRGHRKRICLGHDGGIFWLVCRRGRSRIHGLSLDRRFHPGNCSH